LKEGSDHQRLAEVFGPVGLRYKEIPAEDEELRLFACAHGVPGDVEVGRAFELVNGDVLFFDRSGRYVGLGSSYDDPALFWPRGKDEPVAGGSSCRASLSGYQDKDDHHTYGGQTATSIAEP
jgi:hypothetical protein